MYPKTVPSKRERQLIAELELMKIAIANAKKRSFKIVTNTPIYK